LFSFVALLTNKTKRIILYKCMCINIHIVYIMYNVYHVFVYDICTVYTRDHKRTHMPKSEGAKNKAS